MADVTDKVKVSVALTVNELTNLMDALQAFTEDGGVDDWTDEDTEALDRAYQKLMDAEVQAGRRLARRHTRVKLRKEKP